MNDNLDQFRAISAFGEAHIKELGNSHKNIAKVIKEKRRLSLEAFSRIKTRIPMARAIQLVRKTARANRVKL
jgi:hypothetical protein